LEAAARAADWPEIIRLQTELDRDWQAASAALAELQAGA
jgi:hypothetical protein